MVIKHNMVAMNSRGQLIKVKGHHAKSTEKLSSGYRINRAADDAAGLAISEKMRKQLRGLSQATKNGEDGISLVQTADGALEEVQQMLQRMNELCIQAANGTNSTTDRSYIQDEIDQLKTEIDRVAETTKFNELYLLKGDLASPVSQAARDEEYKRLMATALNGDEKGKSLSLEEINQIKGLKIIYTEVEDAGVAATQTPTGNATTAGHTALKDDLMKEMVPQAVTALLQRRKKTLRQGLASCWTRLSAGKA